LGIFPSYCVFHPARAEVDAVQQLIFGAIMPVSIIRMLFAVAVPLGAQSFAQTAAQFEREAMYRRYLKFASLVKGGSAHPHWMMDGSSFWYAEGAPDDTVIWRVDPRTKYENNFI